VCKSGLEYGEYLQRREDGRGKSFQVSGGSPDMLRDKSYKLSLELN
jgi:hypothetical protein